MSFEEAYEEFLIYASKRHKKQGFDTIRQNINKHILPYFENRFINELKVKDFLTWQNTIYGFNFSNNYNRNLFQAFNTFLKYCVLNGYIETNYLELVGSFKKKIEIKDHETYNFFEYYKFRKGIYNIIYKYFFDLLFNYGLRSGEAMALKFSHLDFKRIHICSNMSRRGNREISTPKSRNSNRYIKISLLMYCKLLILKNLYIKEFCECDFDYFIFGGKKPLSPTSVKRYKHNACVLTGVKEITTHEFRHSYATNKIRHGRNINDVSKTLGHSSIAITYDVYVHKNRDMRQHISHTITQNINKVLQSIITHFIV